MPRARRQHAQVALPVGLRRLFTYAVPPSLAEQIRPGHRVRVPFGHRRAAHGYVVAFTTEKPGIRLKKIAALEPEEALFDPEILKLTEWAATYYLCPWGQVLETALPPAIRRGPGPGRRRRAAAAEAEGDAAAAESTLEAGPDGAGAAALPDTLWSDPSMGPSAAPGRPLVLEPEQAAAASEIATAMAARRFAAFLLQGVTGSGKTEVYLEAAERIVSEGGGVLFLVPEIAMGTQILSRVLRRFAGTAGLYHSQTGDAERRRVWEEARAGRLRVVVGTRSAVFVPVRDLRLVVIDEEHEPAYKQEDAPRYHGRDLALVRAQQAQAVAILGTATPSFESLRNVERGKYRLLLLPRRIDRRPQARVTLVDLNEGQPVAEPGRPRPRVPRPVFSPTLLRGIEERLARGEQTILFLNRRGHSPVVQCAACGEALQCDNCDIVLSFHKADGSLRCHYCGAVRHGAPECPSCKGTRFFYGGVGTQKVEEILTEAFPHARVARMDFDAVRRRGAHGRIVTAMEQGEIDVLLGTQMVAKGFHFPRVTLVGVIQADQEMLQPDFRAGERAFQILTQVAGRSGRGPVAGEVIYQSLMPGHPIVQAAAAGDFVAFAEREMEHRRVLGYPPFLRMIDLLVDGKDAEQVRARAERVRESLVRLLPEAEGTSIAGLEALLGTGPPGSGQGGGRASTGLAASGAAAVRPRRGAIEILGPAAMPHARLKGRHRWHVTLKGRSVERMHDAVIAVLEEKAPRGLSGTRILVDVDPIGMG